MCVIVVKPAKQTLKKNVFKQCWEHNKDGGGFMYAENNKIHIFKSMDIEIFWKAYQSIKPHKKDVVLHFRIATGGPINLENCHPFAVNKNLAFAHNGILPIKHNEKQSDTSVFNDIVLKNLPTNFLEYEGMKTLMEGYIGYDKITFMDSLGNITILNEAEGEWVDGLWFSNTYHDTTVWEDIKYTCKTCGAEMPYDYGECTPCYRKRLDNEVSAGWTTTECKECRCYLTAFEESNYVDICEACFLEKLEDVNA